MKDDKSETSIKRRHQRDQADEQRLLQLNYKKRVSYVWLNFPWFSFCFKVMRSRSFYNCVVLMKLHVHTSPSGGLLFPYVSVATCRSPYHLDEAFWQKPITYHVLWIFKDGLAFGNQPVISFLLSFLNFLNYPDRTYFPWSHLAIFWWICLLRSGDSLGYFKANFKSISTKYISSCQFLGIEGPF